MSTTWGQHVVSMLLRRHFVPEPSTSFSYVSWSVLWLCHQLVTGVTAWPINPNPSCSKNRKVKRKEKKSRIKMKRENKIESTINDLDTRLITTMRMCCKKDGCYGRQACFIDIVITTLLQKHIFSISKLNIWHQAYLYKGGS